MTKSTDTLVAGVVAVLKRALAPRDARMGELERRITALESAPKGLSYSGTWQRAASYSRNQGVTHKSAIWVCVCDSTRSEPGTSADWQLAEKETTR